MHWRVHQGETLTSKTPNCADSCWNDWISPAKFCRTSANVTIPLEFERFWLNVLGLHSFQFTKFCIANGLFHSKPPVLSKMNYFWLLWCLKSPWSLWAPQGFAATLDSIIITYYMHLMFKVRGTWTKTPGWHMEIKDNWVGGWGGQEGTQGTRIDMQGKMMCWAQRGVQRRSLIPSAHSLSSLWHHRGEEKAWRDLVFHVSADSLRAPDSFLLSLLPFLH